MNHQQVDIFIKQLTYLPFEDVKSLCSSTSKLYNYCTNPKYNNNWKKLIDDTFGKVDDYSIKLQEIWDKLSLNKNTYNYKVYTQLVNILDIVTQHMIWYVQGDMKSFNKMVDRRPSYLALFLLNKQNELFKQHEGLSNSRGHYIKLINLILNRPVSIYLMEELIDQFIKYKNKKGVKLMKDIIMYGSYSKAIDFL